MSAYTQAIGNKIVNIACLQTTPGQEFCVLNRIRKIFEQSKAKNQVACLKGFGTWDIFVVEEAEDLSLGILGQIGYVENVLNAIEIKAFTFSNDANGVFSIKNISESNYASITFVKISGSADKMIEDLVSVFDQKNIQYAILGETGWCEIIIFTYGNEIVPIIRAWHEINILSTCTNVLKTFTQLSINYDILELYEASLASAESPGKYLKSNTDLTEEIGGTIFVSISVAALPSSYKRILAYWYARKNYELSTLYGYEDIRIRQKVDAKVSMAQFLEDLLFFRNCFGESIIHTSTNIMWLIDEGKLSDPNTERDLSQETLCTPQPLPPFTPYLRDLLYKHLPKQANSIECQLQIYYSKRSHPLVGMSLSFLDRYIKRLYTLLKAIDDTGETPNAELFKSFADHLALAMELRIYGSAFTYTQSNATMSHLAGGIQQCLDAIEFLPMSVCRKISKTFKGFVLTPNLKFSHLNGIIYVPIDDLFKPDHWWLIYHEIGHYLLEHANIIRNDDVTVQRLNELTNDSKFVPSVGDLWQEVVAEILGFLSLFSNDYKAYSIITWHYLFLREPINDNTKSMEAFLQHLLRMYCVKLYDDIRHNRCAFVNSPESDKTKTSIIKNYAKYIDGVKLWAQASCVLPDRSKVFFKNIPSTLIASSNASLISRLVQLLEKVNATVSSNYSQLVNNSDTPLQETDKLVEMILNGQIIKDVIENPSGVILGLVLSLHDYDNTSGVKKYRKLTFRQRIALIVSFCRNKWRRI